jgi:hypothetical protein
LLYRFKFLNPKASDEKTDAAVFRIVYERKLKKNSDKPETINLSTFKPNLTDTQKSKIKLKSHHTGIYQKITFKKKDEV